MKSDDFLNAVFDPSAEKSIKPLNDKGSNRLITKSFNGLTKFFSKRYSPKNPIESLYREILLND